MYHLLEKSYEDIKQDIKETEAALLLLGQHHFKDSRPYLVLEKVLIDLKVALKKTERELDGLE